MSKKYSLNELYKYLFITIVFINGLNVKFIGLNMNLLLIPLIILGFIILFINIFKKNYKLSISLLLLFGFIICLGFANLINVNYTSTYSWILVFIQFIIFALIYQNSSDLTAVGIQKQMRNINFYVCILVFIANIISIVMFLFNYCATRNGVTIGLINDRLFGIYFNCNPAAFLNCMCFVFGLLSLRSNYRYKIFYISSIVLNITYIILSNCRSVILILVFILIVMMYYLLFKQKNYRRAQKIFMVCAVIFGVMISFNVTREALFTIPKLQGLIIKEDEGNRFQLDKIKRVLVLSQNGIRKNKVEIYNLLDDISSGRIELYYDSYHVFRQAPLSGIGTYNFTSMARDVHPNSQVMKQNILHTHNLFFEVLITSGIIGFLFMILFLFKTIVLIPRVLRKYTKTDEYFVILMMFLVVVIEFIGSMFDYGVLYIYSLSSVLFWNYLGYLYWFDKHNKISISKNGLFELVGYEIQKIDYIRIGNRSIKNIESKIVDSSFDSNNHIYQLVFKYDLILNDQNKITIQYIVYYHIMYNNIENEKIEERMLEEFKEILMEDVNELSKDYLGNIIIKECE